MQSGLDPNPSVLSCGPTAAPLVTTASEHAGPDLPWVWLQVFGMRHGIHGTGPEAPEAAGLGILWCESRLLLLLLLRCARASAACSPWSNIAMHCLIEC